MRDVDRRLEQLADMPLPDPPPLEALEARARVRRRRRRLSIGSGLAAGVVLIGAVVVGLATQRLDPQPTPPLVTDPTTPPGSDMPPDSDTAPGGWSALPEAPLRQRHRHVAAWTDHEMIVWGGVVDSGGQQPFASDGAAYNLDAQTWRLLASSPLTSRYEPHVVWTGDELLIWGGRTLIFHPTVQGAAYDPSTDTWREMADSGIPEQVGSINVSQVAWTGQEMFVVGLALERQGEGIRQYTAAYDPATDQWRNLAAMPVDLRSVNTAAWSGRHLIITGSLLEDNQSLATVVYDPQEDAWERRSNAPRLVVGFPRPATAWTGREMLIWGVDPTQADAGLGLAYDPAEDTWRQLPAAPIPGRESHASVWTGQELIIWGGAIRRGGDRFEDRHDGAAYDPQTDQWRQLPTPPLSSRGYPTVVWTGDQLIVWGGGFDDTQPTGATFQPNRS